MSKEQKEAKFSTEYWTELRKQIEKRTFDPCAHPSFVAYYLVAILGFGGLGIWVELTGFLTEVFTGSKLNPESLRVALATFAPAVAGASALQVVWGDKADPSMRAAFVFLFVSLMALSMAAGSPKILDGVGLFLGLLVVVFASWVWWMANAEEKDFLQRTKPESAVGGPISDSDLSGAIPIGMKS